MSGTDTAARNAALSSISWRLADIDRIRKNGCKVFSCFSCGGGSSMGYKLAGYDVVGNVEIDKDIAKVYSHNLHPRYSFNYDFGSQNVKYVCGMSVPPLMMARISAEIYRQWLGGELDGKEDGQTISGD